MNRHALALVALFSVCASRAVLSQSADTAQALCYRIEKTVNGLVDFTDTQCLPAKGKGQTVSFIVLAEKPVFATAASKKAWLLVVVAAVGDALNRNPRARGDELWLSDVAHMKNRVGYVMEADVAKSLQRRVKNDQISLEGMYSEIVGHLKEKHITR